jgi:serine phosphatase RsbU (regulator of sigma subunit)/ligand-binding sensor domain-containing protein
MAKSFTILLGFLLAFSIQHSPAQTNRYGIHLIKNYDREAYDANPQNWSIAQDQRGVIYLGNEGKILEYDGTNWRKIPNNNGSLVRSLAVGPDGTIYAGGVGEFGYLKPDRYGKLRYSALSRKTDTTFKNVWKTYTSGDTVYFCTRNHIFQFRKDSLINITNLTDWHFLDFMVNGKLYLGNYKKGLMTLENNKAVMLRGGDFYSEKDIFVILPFNPNKLLIGVQKNGLFIYNTRTGRSKSINTLGQHFRKLNQHLQQSTLYNGIKLRDGNYVFATLDDGLIIADSNTGEMKFHYDENNGLQDEVVIAPFESSNGNLWLGLNNGIAKIEYNSPFTHYSKKTGFKGFPLDVIRFNGKIFVATTNGVFQQQFTGDDQDPFKPILNINYPAWAFLKMTMSGNQKARLLIGSHQGIYDITDANNIIQLDKGLENVFKTNTLIQSSGHPGRIYAGYTGGIVEFEYRSGRWIKTRQDQDMTANIKFLAEKDDSTLWAASELSGIFKVVNLRKKAVYDTSDGLPAMNFNRVFQVNQTNHFTTQQGFYRYNAARDAFEPKNLFSGKYSGKKLRYFRAYDRHTFWIIYEDKTGNEKIEKAIVKGNNLKINTQPFKRLGDATFHDFYNDRKEYTWFTSAEGLFIYNNAFEKNYALPYQTLIRSVTLGSDSLLFQGTYYKDTSDYQIFNIQPEGLKQALNFSHNDIAFRFSALFYEEEQALQYSYKLEGYDQEWSEWSTSDYRGYTNLDEGDYVFKAKARNIYGLESETGQYAFRVLPPWYRTVWAYIGYGIAAAGLIILIVKLYTRRLKQEKIRLERIVRERTREVVEQKEKIEQQRDEIARKNRDITDSITYASKIQNAVLPAEEITGRILPEHFILFRPRDIVSGDFYWINKKNDLLFVIAADCTGHGVPGAFMSMLGVSLLNEIVNRHQVTQANQVLNELRDEVKRTLKQTGKEGEAKDGMDISLAMIDLQNQKMQYAGAYNPLYLFRDGRLISYRGDRMPIGIYINEKESFTNHEIDLKEGDVLYLFTDGYPDQFGGPDGGKFKVKRLKKLLAEIHDKPMDQQHNILIRQLDEWRGNNRQLDDILMIGLRINGKE